MFQIYCLYSWPNCFQGAVHCGLHLCLVSPDFTLCLSLIYSCIENLSSLFCPTFQCSCRVKHFCFLLVLEGCRGCRVLPNTTALRYFLCKSTLPTVSDRNHKCPMTISKYFIFSLKLPCGASIQTVKVSLGEHCLSVLFPIR